MQVSKRKRIDRDSLVIARAAAGAIDFVTIDTECDMDAFTVTSWQREYVPHRI